MAHQARRPKHGFPGQHQNEEVLLVFRRHLMVLRKPLIVTGLLIVLALLPVAVWPTNDMALKLMAVIVLVALAYFFWKWVGWFYSVYIATNERIIEVQQHGFFERKVTEFGLDKVQNINYHIKGFQAVLFRYGDITVRTYVGDLVMSGIHKPVDIQEQLVEIVQEYAGSTAA